MAITYGELGDLARLLELYVDIVCDGCGSVRTVEVGHNGLCGFCEAELDEMIDCVVCEEHGFCLNHIWE